MKSTRSSKRSSTVAVKRPLRNELALEAPLEFLQHLWVLNHALERTSQRMHALLGVTAQQRLALRCIGLFPGISPGVLSTLLRVDPGTTSATLRRLEARALIAREVNRQDLRKTTLRLTARGEQLNQQRQGTVEDAVRRLLRRTRAQERASAVKVLNLLTTLLEEDSAHTKGHRAR